MSVFNTISGGGGGSFPIISGVFGTQSNGKDAFSSGSNSFTLNESGSCYSKINFYIPQYVQSYDSANNLDNVLSFEGKGVAYFYFNSSSNPANPPCIASLIVDGRECIPNISLGSNKYAIENMTEAIASGLHSQFVAAHGDFYNPTVMSSINVGYHIAHGCDGGYILARQPYNGTVDNLPFRASFAIPNIYGGTTIVLPVFFNQSLKASLTNINNGTAKIYYRCALYE